MDSQEFLNNLLLKFDSDDCEIINMAFRKDHIKPLNESNCQKKNKIVTKIVGQSNQ